MNCPVCNRQMRMLSRDGRQIYACLDCKSEVVQREDGALIRRECACAVCHLTRNPPGWMICQG